MNDEKMIVAIDYDDSFTTNKVLFSNFIEMIKLSDTHIPIFCTAREGLSFNPLKDSESFKNWKNWDKRFVIKNYDIYQDCFYLNIPVVFCYGYESKRDALTKHGYRIYKDESFYGTNIKLSNVIYFDDYPENIISMYKKNKSSDYKIVDDNIFYDSMLLFKTKSFDQNNNEQCYLWIQHKRSENYEFLYTYKVFDITKCEDLITDIDDMIIYCDSNPHDYMVDVKISIDIDQEILKNDDVKFL